MAGELRRRSRDYKTASGRRPVKDFIATLSDEDTAAVLAALNEVATEGLRAARHLRGDIYEVRADGHDAIYRVLFAKEGKGRVLLALEGIAKKTPTTPARVITLAEKRLTDWRARGALTRLILVDVIALLISRIRYGILGT